MRVALSVSRRSWTLKPPSAARAGVPLITMDAIAVVFAGILVALCILAMLAAWHPRRGRRPVTEPRRGPDYEAMADVESRDIDDMLDAVISRRRRMKRRDVGEELADELMRATWERDKAR